MHQPDASKPDTSNQFKPQEVNALINKLNKQLYFLMSHKQALAISLSPSRQTWLVTMVSFSRSNLTLFIDLSFYFALV